jgi:hypothetical protein
MDNSSRNIVIFIGTITFSVMLLMAAHLYADWRKAGDASTVEMVKADAPAPAAEEVAAEETELAKEEEEEEFPEDEDFPLIGEPMVNIDGDDATSSISAPLPSPQPADAAPAESIAEGYEANN